MKRNYSSQCALITLALLTLVATLTACTSDPTTTPRPELTATPAITATPKDPAEENFQAGEREYAQRRYEQAIQYLNDAIRRRENYAEAYRVRGLAQAQLRKFDLALRDFAQAIELAPGNAKTYGSRGWMQLWQSNQGAVPELLDLAINDLNTALSIDPEYADAYLWRGIAYVWMPIPARAIKNLNVAILLKPNYPEAYFYRGRAKSAGIPAPQRVQAAIDDYTIAIDTYQGDYVEALTYRIVAFNVLKRFDEAINDCKRALAAKGDTYLLYFRCGLAYASNPGKEDVGNAILYFGRAIEKDPDDARAARFQRGVLNWKLRQYDQVITDLTRVIEVAKEKEEPGYVECHYYLGMAYKAQGDRAAAAQELSVFLATSQATNGLRPDAEKALNELR